MSKYSIDYEHLEKFASKKKHFRYEDVKDKLVKVAFDIVKFRDDYQDIDGLWQIRNTDDGEVIVAMYSAPELKVESSGEGSVEKKASLREWEVIPGNDKCAHFFFMSEPVYKIASSDLGEVDLEEFCGYSTKRLNTDKEYVVSLAKELSEDKRGMILSKSQLTK